MPLVSTTVIIPVKIVYIEVATVTKIALNRAKLSFMAAACSHL